MVKDFASSKIVVVSAIACALAFAGCSSLSENSDKSASVDGKTTEVTRNFNLGNKVANEGQATTAPAVAKVEQAVAKVEQAVAEVKTNVSQKSAPINISNNANNPNVLSIAHISDHHSNLETIKGAEFNLGAPTQVSLGGIAGVTTVIKALEKANPNLLKIHAGDAVTGTLYYTFYKGKADAELMNNICFHTLTLGNHEFDDGDRALAKFLGYLGEGDCKTTVLSANVQPKKGTPIYGLSKPYTVKTIAGKKVGIIGITIAQKTKNSSNPLPTTKFANEVITAQKYINELKKQKIDRIVVVTHQGYGADLAMAKKLSGVDVIIGGDSHSLLGDFSAIGLNSEGSYPTVAKNKDGNMVCVAHAWEYNKVVGNLEVTFDEKGFVTNCGGKPILIVADDFRRQNAEKKWVAVDEKAKNDILAIITKTQGSVQVVTPDEKAVNILAGYSKKVDEEKKKVIGTAMDSLCLVREPGEGSNRSASIAGCESANKLARGSDIVQSVAEAYFNASKLADASIQNAGGVRVGIAKGEITMNSAFQLLPFDNVLVELSMTGAEIQASLEEAVANWLDKKQSNGSHPYAYGMRWDLDMSKNMGNRFSNIEIQNRKTGKWAKLNPNAKYVIVTNDFIAGGKDGYETFGKVTKSGRTVNTYLLYTQSYVDYVINKKQISRPSSTSYSHKSVITKDGQKLANN